MSVGTVPNYNVKPDDERCAGHKGLGRGWGTGDRARGQESEREQNEMGPAMHGGTWNMELMRCDDAREKEQCQCGMRGDARMQSVH